MKNYIANKESINYYKRLKKEINIYILMSPVFLFIASFLFILGAKSEKHLYFSVFLIFLMLIAFIGGFYLLTRKAKQTVVEINISNNLVRFRTMKVLFFKSKLYFIKTQEINKINRQYNFYGEKKNAWDIKVGKLTLILFKDFFSKELFEQL